MSCDECQRWAQKDGVISRRDGAKQPRVIGTVTPCWMCPKIPGPQTMKRHRSMAVDMSEKNWRAYAHYLECRAVNSWPDDDPIVRRNARLIREVFDDFEREQQREQMLTLGMSLLRAIHK